MVSVTRKQVHESARPDSVRRRSSTNVWVSNDILRCLLQRQCFFKVAIALAGQRDECEASGMLDVEATRDMNDLSHCLLIHCAHGMTHDVFVLMYSFGT